MIFQEKPSLKIVNHMEQTTQQITQKAPISKKGVFGGAIALWLIGYTITLLTGFIVLHFEGVGFNDTIPTLFLKVNSNAIFYFSPIYFLLILLAFGSKRRLVVSIIVSIPIAYWYLSMALISWSHGISEGVIIGLTAVISFVSLLLISNSNFETKTIFKLFIFGIALFFLVEGYITARAAISYRAKENLKSLAEQAIANKDVALCEKIPDESRKKDIISTIYIKCISEIAVETKNIDLCDKFWEPKFGGSGQYTFCLGEFARTSSDPNLCVSKITSHPENYTGDWKQHIGWCFNIIFTHPLYPADSNMCEKLESEWKEICLKEASSPEIPPRFYDEIRK